MYKNVIAVFALTFSFSSAIGSEPVELVTPFQKLNSIEHGVMRYETGQFTSLPANHGLWSWDGGEEMVHTTRHRCPDYGLFWFSVQTV